MKNSGGGSGARRDTNDVFDFLLGNREVVGDVREVVAGDEPIHDVLDARAAVDYKRQTKRTLGIDARNVNSGRESRPSSAGSVGRGFSVLIAM